MAANPYQQQQQQNPYETTPAPYNPQDDPNNPPPYLPQYPNTRNQTGGGGSTLPRAPAPTLDRASSNLPPTTPPPAKYSAQAPTDPNKFVGFDPNAHTGQTFDTSNPSEGMKYAVQNTLNDMDPNDPDWADKAMAALKQQFGNSVPISVLRGPDGSARLTYGDESVSSGGASGGGAKGKFTWTAAQSGDTNFGGGGGQNGGGFGSGGNAPPMDQATHDAILRLLARGEKPVTGEDVSAQYQPAAAAMERQGQLARAASAQRGSIEGTNIGGGGGPLDATVNSIHEDIGSQQGQLMAKLLGDELQARRGDVANAIQFAQGEEKTALQRQLGLIDAQLRQTQLNQQNQQFYDNMGYNIGRDQYAFNQQNANQTDGY